MALTVVALGQTNHEARVVPRMAVAEHERCSDPLVQLVVEALGVHKSDGRFVMQGTWADKMTRFGARKPAPIGEIRTAADLEAMPRDVRCYAVYLPSQHVIRWAVETQALVVLGGTRHDFLNRGDALREDHPRRGFITVRRDGTVVATSEVR